MRALIGEIATINESRATKTANKVDLRPLWSTVEDMLDAIKELRGQREYDAYADHFKKAVSDSDVETLLSMGADLAYDIGRGSDSVLPDKWKKVAAKYR